MELHQFKEILLGFLEDITNIPGGSKAWFFDEDKQPQLFDAPQRFKVLSPYVLVRVTTASKVPDRPNPEPEVKEGSDCAFAVPEEPKEEIYMCRIKFKIYTEANIYYITSVWLDYHANYFGCQVNSRTSRVGEDWTRGNDLSDGYFCRKTWEKIKSDIIRFEMKALSKYVEHGHWAKPKAVGDPSKENTLQGEPYKSSKHAEKGNTRKI